MIKGLAFLEVVVKDFDKSLEWYTKVLGFSVYGGIEEAPDGLWCQLETKTGDHRLALWRPNWLPGEEKEHYSFVPVFEVSDLDKLVTELKEKDVIFIEEIRKTPHHHITTITDPEGNRLQLFMPV